MRYIKKLPGFRSGSRWKMALASAGYLLIVLTVIGLFVDTEPDDDALAASEPTATATIAPDPTTAPLPTETPEPAPTNAPAVENTYLTDVSILSSVVSTAMIELGELSENYRDDEDWSVQAGTQLGILRNTYTEGLKLIPVDGYWDFHSLWLDGLQLLDEATWLYADGVDGHNPDLLKQAGDKIEEAGRKFSEAESVRPDSD